MGYPLASCRRATIVADESLKGPARYFSGRVTVVVSMSRHRLCPAPSLSCPIVMPCHCHSVER